MNQCEMCSRNPDLEFKYKTHQDYLDHMEMVHHIRFDHDTGKSLKSDKPWIPPGTKEADRKNPL